MRWTRHYTSIERRKFVNEAKFSLQRPREGGSISRDLEISPAGSIKTYSRDPINSPYFIFPRDLNSTGDSEGGLPRNRCGHVPGKEKGEDIGYKLSGISGAAGAEHQIREFAKKRKKRGERKRGAEDTEGRTKVEKERSVDG